MIISSKGKVSVQIEQYFSYKLINNWIKAKLSLTFKLLLLCGIEYYSVATPPGLFCSAVILPSETHLLCLVSTRMFICYWFVLGTRIIL